MTSRTDEELARLAASGDRTAEELLVSRYHRVVRTCVRPYFLSGGDSEDLAQEGMFGLISAIREFEIEKETSFRTCAESCIRNRLKRLLRDETRDKR